MTPSETAELQDFISGELQKVHSRLDGVDGKLDGLGNRLERVEGGMDGLGTRLDGVEEGLGGLREDQARMESLAARQFARIDASLAKAETAREETQRDFSAFREDLKSTNRKLDESRDEMRRGFQEQRDQTRAGFAQWGERTTASEGRVERLETGGS